MFCVVKGREQDGLGKLVSTGAECFVQYFDTPAEDGVITCSIPKSSIVGKRLGRNTRVFVYRELDNRWRVGRVQEDDGSGLYIRFSHKEDTYVPYSEAFVRWKNPIANPAQFLARFITETPQYAEARSGFLHSYSEQRGAAFGIQALLSSSVEMNSHQIDVVRRVLNDPSQRYLLADEVGLGKTIEAGIIIRQAVLDDPAHRVVVLVPDSLVRQWRQELAHRFGLQILLDDSVFVLAQEAGREQVAALKGATLLVVDEAHHVAAPGAGADVDRLYELLRQAARRIDRLLLLSATPILRNEEGFLRMLHLLDPVVYPLEDHQGFRLRIQHRQALAEVVAMLTPDNALFLDEPLDDLAARIPHDDRLQRLIAGLKEQLLEMPDEEDEVLIAGIRQLRAHISETYKLNRRILRNRRRQVIGLTPNRSGARRCVVTGSPMARIESALEAWRITATAAYGTAPAAPAVRALSSFYWEIARACLEDPDLLPALCARRRALPAWPDGDALGRFDGEDALLAQLAKLCDGDAWMEARCTQLIDVVRGLPAATKAVVFCSKADVADAVFERLKQGHINAVRHGVELDEDADLDEAESWAAFMTNPVVGIIVCDRRAEEGLNLQGGNKAVIHVDLPLEPNRVEQRMGRVDRYGAGNQIRSFVLFDQGASLQQAWVEALQEGWRVFDHSISSLQYLVEDEIASLKERLFAGGAEAIQELTQRLAGSAGLVATELKLIDQQDALDELSPLPESETDRLFEIDDEWRTIRQAMLYWTTETLLFSAIPVAPVAAAGAVTPIEQPVRFHYHPPDSGGKATLIPLTGFLGDFLGAIDYEAPGSRASEPRSFPHLAHRTSAVKRNARLMRYGDEFVEAVKSFSDLDDRGRSFAMWRQLDSGLSPGELKMCFRFDFLVETRLDEAEAVMTSALGDKGAAMRAVLSRRGDALLAPFIVHIWLDEEGDELPADFVEEHLAPKYAKAGAAGYIDKNLGPEHYRALQRLAPEFFGNWHDRCLRMHERARTLVLARPDLAQRKKLAIERARAEDEVRHAQWRSRVQSLDGPALQAETVQFQLEQWLNDALYEGIAIPSLITDVSGVSFLSDRPVSVLDALMGSGE